MYQQSLFPTATEPKVKIKKKTKTFSTKIASLCALLSCTDARNLSSVIFCRDWVELDSFHEDIFQPKVRYSLSFFL